MSEPITFRPPPPSYKPKELDAAAEYEEVADEDMEFVAFDDDVRDLVAALGKDKVIALVLQSQPEHEVDALLEALEERDFDERPTLRPPPPISGVVPTGRAEEEAQYADPAGKALHDQLLRGRKVANSR